jgi:nitroreductase
MIEINEVRPAGGPAYRKVDLMNMDSVSLKGLLRERTHHNIEVPLYTTLLKWKGLPIPTFGLQAQLTYDIWHERNLPENGPDMEWIKEHLALAKNIREGQKVDLDGYLPAPFTETEMAVVNKLLYMRRSCRDWLDKPVPDWMIEQILEAGRAAPIGCNLGEVRFIVITDPEEAKMVWSDISTKNAVLIVICYDKRIQTVVGQDTLVPQNAGFDCAAATDHMLLMAHALGLGACWLSKTTKCDIAEDSGKKFQQLYGLPEYIEPACHIAVGWPAIMPAKSKRAPLSEMLISREDNSK